MAPHATHTPNTKHTYAHNVYIVCILYICSIPKGGYIPVGQIPVHMTGNESRKKKPQRKLTMGKCLNHRTGQTPIENENDTKRYAWMCLCIYCYVQHLYVDIFMYIYYNSIRYESLFDFADIRTPLGFFIHFSPVLFYVQTGQIVDSF